MKSIFAVMALGGCITVPQTQIKVDPEKKSVNIQSPKDVVIKDFKASFNPTATGTVVLIEFKDYQSKNSIDVIKAVADHNAKSVERAAGLLGELLDKAQ
jgi:hypothetical protein